MKNLPEIPDFLRLITNGNTPYGLKALQNEIYTLSGTKEGIRNTQLNRSAYSLAQLVAGGELQKEKVETDLTNAGIQLGLSEKEVNSTLKSAFGAGINEPRIAPPNRENSKQKEKQNSELENHRFGIITANECLLPQKPIQWIIENLIGEGSVNLLVGEGGSKKTFSCLDLGVRVSQGLEWLNLKTIQGPVLFIDEESGKKRIIKRLGDAQRGLDIQEEIPFYVISLAHIDLRNQEDISHLHKIILEVQAKLVFIDTLASVMPGGDENAVKDIQPLFIGLRQIAESTGAAIIIIHHANKAGGYRGSTAMKGAVDLMLMVESKKESNQITFKTEKARDIEPINFGANIHFEEDKFWLTSSELSGISKSFSKSEEYVLRYLKENGESGIPEIRSNADTCSDNAARLAVYSLVEKGMLHRTNPGESGQGVVAKYEITNQGGV